MLLPQGWQMLLPQGWQMLLPQGWQMQLLHHWCPKRMILVQSQTIGPHWPRARLLVSLLHPLLLLLLPQALAESLGLA
jgi:hypothetical protein